MTTTTMMVSGRWECGEGIGRKGVGRGGCYMQCKYAETFFTFSVSAPSSLFHRCSAVHLHAVYSYQSVPDKEATSAAP